MNISQHIKDIFSISSEKQFEKLTLDTFYFQAEHCAPYKEFLQHLRIEPCSLRSIQEIPFLPVEFFKSHRIITSPHTEEAIFTSSGTTGTQSKHYVASLELYEKSFTAAFNQFYGQASDYTILALLPSYLERSGSSLVYMADKLIKASLRAESGFFLDKFEDLLKLLKQLENKRQPTVLLGVSYALLDLAERCDFPLNNTIVMETGGMKGKRKEMTKQELHASLKKQFKCKKIHSEYGMTELLSQAYSKGDGVYSCPPWMKVLVKELHDPFANCQPHASGQINIIDLANLYSCSFIASSDLGKLTSESDFSIIGRKDNSDIRGCNLLLS